MAYEITAEALPERMTLVKRARLAYGDIGDWLHRAHRDVVVQIAAHDVPVTGPPFARYALDGELDVEAGLPVAARVPARGGLVMSSLPATTAAVTCHVGPYDRLGDARDALEKWIRDRGFEPAGRPWEVYLTDPRWRPDPERRTTVVIMPYRAIADGG